MIFSHNWPLSGNIFISVNGLEPSINNVKYGTSKLIVIFEELV